MIGVLSLAGMVTMSIAHPYFVGRYKVMVSNINLVKDHGCSDTEVLPCALVKYYSLGGSGVRPNIHTFIPLYEGPF